MLSNQNGLRELHCKNLPKMSIFVTCKCLYEKEVPADCANSWPLLVCTSLVSMLSHVPDTYDETKPVELNVS